MSDDTRPQKRRKVFVAQESLSIRCCHVLHPDASKRMPHDPELTDAQFQFAQRLALDVLKHAKQPVTSSLTDVCAKMVSTFNMTQPAHIATRLHDLNGVDRWIRANCIVSANAIRVAFERALCSEPYSVPGLRTVINFAESQCVSAAHLGVVDLLHRTHIKIVKCTDGSRSTAIR